MLEDQGLIDPEKAENHRRDLVRAFVVDLPFDETRLLEVAQENDFEAGPATAAFSRPATWIDPARSLDFLRQLISFLMRGTDVNGFRSGLQRLQLELRSMRIHQSVRPFSV